MYFQLHSSKYHTSFHDRKFQSREVFLSQSCAQFSFVGTRDQQLCLTALAYPAKQLVKNQTVDLYRVDEAPYADRTIHWSTIMDVSGLIEAKFETFVCKQWKARVEFRRTFQNSFINKEFSVFFIIIPKANNY